MLLAIFRTVSAVRLSVLTHVDTPLLLKNVLCDARAKIAQMRTFELIRSLIFLNLFEKVPVHGKQTCNLEGLSNVLSANSMESKDSAH